MIALKIDDRKQFTSSLFIGDAFDSFLVKEANIVTFNSFTIDGHIRKGYYSDEELVEGKVEGFSSWHTLKPFCFSLIKGKKLPGSFQIVFQLAPAGVDEFLSHRQVPFPVESINGLYLNVRYEEGSLYCVSGTSVNYFTMDKTLDQAWDEAVRSFLKTKKIDFTEE